MITKSKLVKLILHLIYPVKCEICAKLLSPENEKYLCDTCRESIILRDKLYFAPYDYLSASDSFYRLKYHFDSLHVIGDYQGVLKKCIHLLKYNNKRSLLKPLASLIVECIRDKYDMGAFDYIIPVPLHKKRRFERNYNQVELLLKEIARSLGINSSVIIANNLTRVRNTKPQYGLTKKQRYHNIRDAFIIKKPSVFKGKSIFLTDDVYTTGITINECARVLREAGASRINALVLAHSR